MSRTHLVLVFGVLGALAFACGSSDSGEHAVSYAITAKSNYEKGLAELKDENWPEAQKYFTFVKQKFPFSKYAVLAELRLADTQFERGHYLEAIDQYKLFGRSHPTHELVDDGYVGFKICESYYKQIPEDFFLLPPAYEKDQSPTRDALREIDLFLEKWPKSKYIDKARKYRELAVRSLAASEFYVARFYFDHGKYRAATWRLETLMKQYSGTTLDADALLLLGNSYQKLKEPERARRAFTRLVQEHPKAQQAHEAEGRLRSLPTPPAAPASPTPAHKPPTTPPADDDAESKSSAPESALPAPGSILRHG
jgi:outer membrane protein assembly factor BamD